MGKKDNDSNVKITIEEKGKDKVVIDSDGYLIATTHEEGPTNMRVGVSWSSFTYEEILRLLASINHQCFCHYILPHIDNCDHCGMCPNSKEEEVSE